MPPDCHALVVGEGETKTLQDIDRAQSVPFVIVLLIASGLARPRGEVIGVRFADVVKQRANGYAVLRERLVRLPVEAAGNLIDLPRVLGQTTPEVVVVPHRGGHLKETMLFQPRDDIPNAIAPRPA